MAPVEHDKKTIKDDRRKAQVARPKLPTTLNWGNIKLMVEPKFPAAGIVELTTFAESGRSPADRSLVISNKWPFEGNHGGIWRAELASPSFDQDEGEYGDEYEARIGDHLKLKKDRSRNERSEPDHMDKKSLLIDIEHRLSEYEDLLEAMQWIGRLHKDAVQDAVDIVQTRRLDFKDVPVSTSADEWVQDIFFYLALEIGIVAAAGSAAATASVIGAAMTVKFLAGLLRNLLSRKNIKKITKKVAMKARREEAKLVKQSIKKWKVGGSGGATQQYLGPKFQKSDESINIMKIWDAGQKPKNELPDIAWFTDTAESVANAVYKSKPTKLYSDTRDKTRRQNSLPLDIVLKTRVAGVYDDAIMELERQAATARLVLRTLRIDAETMEIDSFKLLHQSLIHLIPKFENLDQFIEDFDKFFYDWKELKERLTENYERIIWILLFSGEVRVKYEYKVLKMKQSSAMDLLEPGMRSQWVEITEEEYNKKKQKSKNKERFQTQLRSSVPDGKKYQPLLDYFNRRFLGGRYKNDVDVVAKLQEDTIRVRNILKEMRTGQEASTVLEVCEIADAMTHVGSEEEKTPSNA